MEELAALFFLVFGLSSYTLVFFLSLKKSVSLMKLTRDYIRKHMRIIALIGLPHLAFQVTGANNEGNLIFLEKVKAPPEDYDIYIDWAGYVGIDTTGKKIQRNDLKEILDRMKKPKPENVMKFSQLEERIDPWYYHPNYRLIKRNMKKSKHSNNP